jgi:hypothetical protein
MVEACFSTKHAGMSATTTSPPKLNLPILFSHHGQKITNPLPSATQATANTPNKVPLDPEN